MKKRIKNKKSKKRLAVGIVRTNVKAGADTYKGTRATRRLRKQTGHQDFG